MNRNVMLPHIILPVFLLVLLGIGCSSTKPVSTTKEQSVVYGISPYQDTILPIVAEKQGWYKEAVLSPNFKVIDWGDVMTSIAGGAVDVGISDLPSFQAAAESINGKGGDVIFYYPMYVFKGSAIMIRGDGKIKPLSYFKKQFPNDRKRALFEAMKQLKGKTILTTKGTNMEQMVVSAIEIAHLKPDIDVRIVHAEPSDSLAAFLRGEGDGFCGGVTQRTEASRHGAVVLIDSSEGSGLATLDGLATTKRFATAHPDILNKLILLWFRTIRFMEPDLEHRATLATDYLSTVGSTKYTVDEFKYTWFNMQIYYMEPRDVEQAFYSPNSTLYWKTSWDANNNFLLTQKKIKSPIPYDDFWGEKVQGELTGKVQPQLSLISTVRGNF